MLSVKQPVEMPVVKEVPEPQLLITLLNAGLNIAGGFPLFLVGGSDIYSDIDVYANNWPLYMQGFQLLSNNGKLVAKTPHSTIFDVHSCNFQLVEPSEKSYSESELIAAADMTPSACLLKLKDSQFVALVQYPDDIALRICRILEKHDWTEFRKNVYRSKGYTIIDD